MSELKDLMWVEKYRPEKINEFINQESTIKRLKPIIKNSSFVYLQWTTRVA